MGKHLVSFFDTPGLADGEHDYPFPVEQVILELAKSMDLILVFYDPVGQALCSRTSRVVGTLNRLFRNKLRFYLTKADTIDRPEDAHKIIFQIAQNLPCKNHAASLPMISLPHFCSNTVVDDSERHIDSLRADFNKAIEEKVQDELLRAIDDTDQILKSLEMSDQMQTHARRHNRRIVMWRTALAMILTTASVCLLIGAIAAYDECSTRSCLENVLPKAILESEPRRILLSRYRKDSCRTRACGTPLTILRNKCSTH
mmetsp:Transcript_40058/g.159355  ORF Transcript_40058/g.159355 Transcript_40058/m.159355 type:complete len:257 (-) Transcript_40058:679-1449(-)